MNVRSHHRLLALLVALSCLTGAALAQPSGADHVIARLDLKQATMVDAARLIAELTGINVITSPEAAAQPITAFLQGVTAESALDTICRAHGLWYRRDEGVGRTFRVMTAAEYQRDLVVARDDEVAVLTLLNPNAILVATAVRDVYGPRVRLSMGLNSEDRLFEMDAVGSGSGGGFGGEAFLPNAGLNSSGRVAGSTSSRFGSSTSFTRSGTQREDAFQGDLTSDQLALLTERLAVDQAEGQALLAELDRRELPIYLSVVRQQNLIVVRTSDAKAMADITALVQRLDQPTPQVFLVVKVLEISLGDDFRSVFDIEVISGADGVTGTGSIKPVNPLAPGAATGFEHVLGTGNFELEPNTLIYQLLDNDLRVRLQLLETEDRINLVSSPVLLASNNLPSRLFVGEERVLTTGVNTSVVTPATGATTTAIEPVTEVRDIGNTLLIRPKINGDRSVTLVINQDSSSVLEDATTIPVSDGSGGITEFAIDTVNTASLETVVVAHDGLTVAIGGLIRESEVDIEQKVPILGDIPLLGFFFRRTVKSSSRSEIVILITPHVISVPEDGGLTLPVLEEISQVLKGEAGEGG